MHLAANRHALLLANRVAVDLGLDDPNGPPAVLAQTMEVLGDRDDSNVVYMYLLNACEKLFDNDLDQATFEEHMRWFFGNKVGREGSNFCSSAYLSSSDRLLLGVSAVHTRQAHHRSCETGECPDQPQEASLGCIITSIDGTVDA